MSSAKKRKVVHSQARTMVACVISYFDKEKHNKGPILDVKNALQRTADACGISLRLVQKIKSEIREVMAQNFVDGPMDNRSEENVEDQDEDQPSESDGKNQVILHTPRKGRGRFCKVTNIDDFDKAAVRRHLIAYYERKEVPTLRKLQISLRESGLFVGGFSSVRKLVLDLGFKYKKMNKRKVLVEKPSVALSRCRFLRKIHNVDLKKTIFLDETWLNANESKDYGWTDDTVKGTLETPLGKGKRLIICHAGGQGGWIKAPPLVFESKKTGDYHEDMNSTVFENWFFKTLIPVIPRGSTIVMDNAPYHSRVKDKAPTSSSTKGSMMKWLEDRGIPFTKDLRKPEVYQLVRLHKPPMPTYEIDDKATKLGFSVIRLPPYHCHYNPIEMVWSTLKRHVRERNTTFKIQDVKDLFLEAVHMVKPEHWMKYVDHVKKLLDEDWKKEGLDEQSVQQFLINLTPGESDDSDSSDSDSDIEENDLGASPLL